MYYGTNTHSATMVLPTHTEPTGASRNPESTVPEELQRQSKRISEQLTALNVILDTITAHLEEMQGMMKSYSPELVKQIGQLYTYLTDYKSRASKIYGEVGDSLSKYAYNLLHNLDNLTSSVSEIGKSIENLK